MKLNWGTGITITIAFFMVHILFLVYKTTTAQTDLQAEDYYSQEINYQERLQAKNNTKGLSDEFSLIQTENDLLINYPDGLNFQLMSGSIELFKPDNAKLDKEITIQPKAIQKISKSELIQGWYVCKIKAESNAIPYYFEQSIYIN